MATPPVIGGRSLGGEKYTVSCCRDREEEPNEEEYPRKRTQAETITKSSAPPGTGSMFKMLLQTDNQCSKVDVKHRKWFWCEICDIHVKNWDGCNFTIGCWWEHNGNGGHRKALANKIAIAELKNREKSGDILNKKEKRQLNFGNNSNTSLLEDSSRRKGRMVAVVPRHPLRLELPMVQTRKHISWFIHRPRKTCRYARKNICWVREYFFSGEAQWLNQIRVHFRWLSL